SDIEGFFETRRINRIIARSVAQEIDCSQPGAEVERFPPNVGDAVADGDAGHGAAPERTVPDPDDAVRDGVAAAGFAAGILDERVLALAEQDPIQTGVNGVGRIHDYRGQVGAAKERTVSNAGDAGGNGVTPAPAARKLHERALVFIE